MGVEYKGETREAEEGLGKVRQGRSGLLQRGGGGGKKIKCDRSNGLGCARTGASVALSHSAAAAASTAAAGRGLGV